MYLKIHQILAYASQIGRNLPCQLTDTSLSADLSSFTLIFSAGNVSVMNHNDSKIGETKCSLHISNDGESSLPIDFGAMDALI